MEILSKYAPESVYSDLLAKQLKGKREVTTPVGNIDVLTELEVIEVKHLVGWKGALGRRLGGGSFPRQHSAQVAAYAIYYPGHGKRVHLIGEPLPKQKDLVEITAAKVNTRVTWITPIVFANYSPLSDVNKAIDLSHPLRDKIKLLAMLLQGYEMDGGVTVETIFHSFKLLELDRETIKLICEELYKRGLLLRRQILEFNIYGKGVEETNKYAYHLLISKHYFQSVLKKK